MNTDGIILLVEDNDDEAELTLRAFTAARMSHAVVRVRDGVEALHYLLGRQSFAARDTHSVPAAVLLDLNLPRLGGLEVLTAIRVTECIKHLPVVVLTSSDEEKDRLEAYRQFANSYVRKPIDYDQFAAVARDLGMYWLVLNRPPPPGSTG